MSTGVTMPVGQSREVQYIKSSNYIPFRPRTISGYTISGSRHVRATTRHAQARPRRIHVPTGWSSKLPHRAPLCPMLSTAPQPVADGRSKRVAKPLHFVRLPHRRPRVAESVRSRSPCLALSDASLPASGCLHL